MILAVYGTTGELIKLAPILSRLRPREDVLSLCTAQQVRQIAPLLADLGLPPVDVWLGDGAHGRDLETTRDVPGWLRTVTGRFLRRRAALRSRAAGAGDPLVLVHGDTMTTVLGGLMGRALRAPVAHVEAGLRSGSWRDPFPEELDRRITSRLAEIHFAPGPWAAGNLRDAGVSGEIVDTGANTIRDALAMVDPAVTPGVVLPDEPFGLVSLHRFELLGDREALREIVDLLHDASRRIPLLFVDHPVTVAAIRDAGLEDRFDDRLRHVPRQRYFAFIALLKASAFLVTDSGGSQEECAQLGHPCVVHRATTERQDGLEDGIVTLSGGDPARVAQFLSQPPPKRPPAGAGSRAPSDVIVGHLRARGFTAPVGAPA